MQSLSPREELIQLQKQIFKKNQKLIQDSMLITQRDFRAYEQNYLHRVNSYERPVEVEELISAILRSQWVYVGDYHTNPQSQRAFLRILKRLIKHGEQFVLCLEFLQKKHQKDVDRFLKNRILLKTFLRKINIRKHFFFDLWENFEPIFDFAKFHNIQIFGIETAPLGSGLKRRDEAMAQSLFEIHQQYPNHRKLIFVGDLHIAPENLPQQVSKKLGGFGSSQNELFIYQNSEKIYWKLAARHLEDKVEIVRLDEKSFCLMNTPPIVWQQSFLNWLEHEEREIDFQDPKHSFLELAHRIARFLVIKLPKSKEDVEVFTCGDLTFLERLKEDPDFSEAQRRKVRRIINHSESYYMPKHKWVYLGNVSLNHAAEEASHFIRHLVAGKEVPYHAEDAFYLNILDKAIGFFGSKIINPKRKCMREKDYQSMLAYFRDTPETPIRDFEKEVAHLVLEIKRLEKRKKSIPNPSELRKQRRLFLSVTHALGYILGEMLYHGLVQGVIKKREVKFLFIKRFEKPGEARSIYMRLAENFEKVTLPERF